MQTVAHVTSHNDKLATESETSTFSGAHKWRNAQYKWGDMQILIRFDYRNCTLGDKSK